MYVLNIILRFSFTYSSPLYFFGSTAASPNSTWEMLWEGGKKRQWECLPKPNRADPSARASPSYAILMSLPWYFDCFHLVNSACARMTYYEAVHEISTSQAHAARASITITRDESINSVNVADNKSRQQPRLHQSSQELHNLLVRFLDLSQVKSSRIY